MKRAYIIAILPLVLFVSGCIMPIPHRRLHAYGVHGSVVCAESKEAIPDAVVALGTNLNASVACDAAGRFEIKPIHGWHGAYFIGPISLSLFPGFDMTFPHATVTATAPGYEVNMFSLADKPEWLVPSTTNGNGSLNVNARRNGKYIDADPLELKRIQIQEIGLPTMHLEPISGSQ
jgi:hypothetical protein